MKKRLALLLVMVFALTLLPSMLGEISVGGKRLVQSADAHAGFGSRNRRRRIHAWSGSNWSIRYARENELKRGIKSKAKPTKKRAALSAQEKYIGSIVYNSYLVKQYSVYKKYEYIRRSRAAKSEIKRYSDLLKNEFQMTQKDIDSMIEFGVQERLRLKGKTHSYNYRTGFDNYYPKLSTEVKAELKLKSQLRSLGYEMDTNKDLFWIKKDGSKVKILSVRKCDITRFEGSEFIYLNCEADRAQYRLLWRGHVKRCSKIYPGGVINKNGALSARAWGRDSSGKYNWVKYLFEPTSTMRAPKDQQVPNSNGCAYECPLH